MALYSLTRRGRGRGANLRRINLNKILECHAPEEGEWSDIAKAVSLAIEHTPDQDLKDRLRLLLHNWDLYPVETPVIRPKE